MPRSLPPPTGSTTRRPWLVAVEEGAKVGLVMAELPRRRGRRPHLDLPDHRKKGLGIAALLQVALGHGRLLPRRPHGRPRPQLVGRSAAPSVVE